MTEVIKRSAGQVPAPVVAVNEAKDRAEKLKAILAYKQRAGAEISEINDHAIDLCETMAGGGEVLASVPRAAPGPRPKDSRTDAANPEPTEFQQVIEGAGYSDRTAGRWQHLARVPKPDRDAYYEQQIDKAELIRPADLWRLGKKLAPHEIGPPVQIKPHTYQCLVIDPPWQMEKIERDEREDQAGFDYPTMTEEELSDPECPKWRGCPPPKMAAKNCHLYLWTTHKHLPMALRLAHAWGFKYECLMTWVKNVGFTPYSWMRSTEHVLFCRLGSLQLLRMGLRLDFKGKVREHSRKPDEFYELIEGLCPGSKAELFQRFPRKGWHGHGDEVRDGRGAQGERAA